MSLCWIVLLTSVSFGQISFHDTFSNKARERIKSDVAKAELIFVATVINVGPPPKFRSGGFMATQGVQYQVEEVLRGKLAEGTHRLEVHHVVIAGSQTGDPSPDANRLSQDIFAPGSHLIVIAVRKRVIEGKRPSWLCVDEDYGAIRATNPNVAAIKQLVSSLGGTADASERARGGHRNVLIPQDTEHPDNSLTRGFPPTRAARKNSERVVGNSEVIAEKNELLVPPLRLDFF